MTLQRLFTCLFIPILLFGGVALQAQWESLGAGLDEQDFQVFSISVVDENVIWVAPNKEGFDPSIELLKTVDGGETWINISLPNNLISFVPEHIYALNDQIAWVVMVGLPSQSKTTIYKTINGGENWIQQQGEFNDDGNAIAALHFFNEFEGIAFGSPGTGNEEIDSVKIYITYNGGEDWNKMPSEQLPTPEAAEGVWIYSGNNSYEAIGDTLWFVTRASRVFRTTTKGNSWEAFDVGISGNGGLIGLSSIAFEDNLNGIAVTYNTSQAAKTTDGGETWVEIEVPEGINIGQIEHIPSTKDTYLASDGFLGDDTEMLFTEDGGATWELLDLPPSMSCMQFISPTIGFGGGVVDPDNDTGIYKWTGDLSDPINTGVEDLVFEDYFMLNANPVDDVLSFSTKKAVGLNGISTEIYSVDGALVMRKVFENVTGTYEMDVAELSVGTYLFKIDVEGGIVSELFIKR